MLQLIQVLYSIRHKAHSLWTLVMAEWDFPSCSESSSWVAKKEVSGFRRLVIAARGVMMVGGYADLLRVHYEKPGKVPISPEKAAVPEDAVKLHTFSPAEIQRYTAEVGDPHPAHEAAEAVPPLLLLKTLLSKQPIHSGQIRFLAPIPVGAEILLAKEGAGLSGYADGVKLFELNMN